MLKRKFSSMATALAAVFSMTSANAVVVDGLEWKPWKDTVGMSIGGALEQYSTDGWRLASNAEMASLFNHTGLYLQPNEDHIDWVETPFKANENSSQIRLSITHGLNGSGFFQSQLGETSPYNCDPDGVGFDMYGCSAHTAALFGSDGDADGLYNLADVGYDYYPGYSSSTSFAELLSDRYDRNWSNDVITASTYAVGVALVRDVTPVPIPATLPLLASALVAFGVWRRKMRTK